MYAFATDGTRDAASDFELNETNIGPAGFTHARDRLLVVDWVQRKVYAYRNDGTVDESSSFDLYGSNSAAVGIAHVDGRFFVLDQWDDKVYAYQAGGQRDASSDFELDADNGSPAGILHADGRFFVVDVADRKVYAYRDNGQRDTSSDFGLYEGSARPGGMTYADGRFYVLDWLRDSVFAFRDDRERDGGGGVTDDETSYGATETITDLPTESWSPDAIVYGRFYTVEGAASIRLGNDGYFEEAGYRFTCRNGGGCEVDGRLVVSGPLVRTLGGVEAPDARPRFDADIPLRDRSYTVGTLIDAITMPQAFGGNGGLTYSLSPEIAGLSFDPNTRQITGTPAMAGTHAVTYTAMDANGDTSALGFTISVKPVAGSTTIEAFDLDENNRNPTGITYADGRLYVFDRDGEVYAYSGDGQRDPAADFGTPRYGSGRRSGSAQGIAHAGNRFYFLCDYLNSYTGDGEPIDSRELGVKNADCSGVTNANGRFHVVSRRPLSVYAYADSGERLAWLDFDLHDENGSPTGITYADGRFYIVDATDQKVYAYGSAGERDATADFELYGGNLGAAGITYTDGRFYVIDWRNDRVYVYPSSGQSGGEDGEIAYGPGDKILSLPPGVWTANKIDRGQVDVVADSTSFRLDDNGYIEERGVRYTCRGFGTGGRCVVGAREVLRGTIISTPRGVAKRDAIPSFADDSGPGDLTFTVGVHIDGLYLPAALGGDGMVTYALTPDVPGLTTLGVGVRWLGGTPSQAGVYPMTYTATDADGDSATHSFTITVRAEYDGAPPEIYDLPAEQSRPRGITYADGRFYVASGVQVTVYDDDWQREPSFDFRLANIGTGNPNGWGITNSDDRFYLLDWNFLNVYAYGIDGQRDATADFELHGDNAQPVGISYADGRLYVLDQDAKVYAYRSDGQRDTAAEFVLEEGKTDIQGSVSFAVGNTYPLDITYADGRFYVVDSNDRVYAYGANGQRDAAADFYLHPENSSGEKAIAYVDGRFFVASLARGFRVFAYPIDGTSEAEPGEASFEAGATISGLPTGTWAPDVTSGASVTSDSDGTRVEFDDGGYIETGGYRYTCQGTGGCEIGSGTVATGTIVRTSVAATPTDTMPAFDDGREPGDLVYEVEAAIDALSLPAASGGDGTLSYSLSPDVPGLSFDATARQLTGTPTTVGTYAMTYTVTDADGDTDSLSFTITVEDKADTSEDDTNQVQMFDLHDDNGHPAGIAHADGRFYVVDTIDDKVYVYGESGQYEATADFDLHDDNDHAEGIAYANGRLYVLDWHDRKVYAYSATGLHEATADFTLESGNTLARGIDFANARFYVGDWFDDKVYAYSATGLHEATADFELHDDNGSVEDIAFTNGQFYVVDPSADKVFAYTSDGHHSPAGRFRPKRR